MVSCLLFVLHITFLSSWSYQNHCMQCFFYFFPLFMSLSIITHFFSSIILGAFLNEFNKIQFIFTNQCNLQIFRIRSLRFFYHSKANNSAHICINLKKLIIIKKQIPDKISLLGTLILLLSRSVFQLPYNDLKDNQKNQNVKTIILTRIKVNFTA